MTTILAFISGKGGTGKTAVSLATAQLLAAGGSRVALYDADLSTRGLTHYLSARVDTSRTGLADSVSLTDVQAIYVGPDSSLDTETLTGSGSSVRPFIVYPIMGDLAGEDADLDVDRAAKNILALLDRGKDEFDYHILDLQAGLTPLLDRLYAQVNTSIVVTEADPVSIAAVSYLRRHLDGLRKGVIYGLVNRALPEEKSFFEALLAYAGEIDWLGVLPSDPDVRRAFFLRGLLLKPQSSDPFGLQLIDTLGRVKRLSESMQGARKWLTAPGHSFDDDFHALIELREVLERQLAEAQFRRDRGRRWIGPVELNMSLIIGLAILLRAESVIPLWAAVVVGVLGVITTAFWRYYQRYIRMGYAEKEISSLRDTLERTDEQLRVYTVGRESRSGSSKSANIQRPAVTERE